MSFIDTSSTAAIFSSMRSDTPARPLATALVYCGVLPMRLANSLLVRFFSVRISFIRNFILQRYGRK